MNKLITILITLSFAGVSFGQKFSATVNRNQVGVGEHFKLTYTIEAQGNRFTPPNFSGFRVLSGPNQSQSMQYINGQMSASLSISYVLRAEKMGEFTIPPATISANGKTLKSNSVSIKVIKGRNTNQNNNTQQAKQPGNEVKDNVFIKLLVNKRNAYVGEQLTATYKIYTRLSIVDNAIRELPAFNGFYSQEIDEKGQGNLTPEIVNGIQYNTAIIKQVVLSPQRSGKLEIEPLSMDLALRIQDKRRGRSVFDQFFGSYRDIQYTAQSNKAVINVERLPEKGKPENFNGAVGVFDLESSLDKNEVKANEAINLVVKLSGKGNVKLLKDPSLEFPPDFEVYDPKESTNIKTSTQGIRGSKTFEYLIIPRHSGEFEIPSYSFSYFDPIRKQFVSKSTPSYKVSVERSGNEAASPGGGLQRSVSKKDIAKIGSDIRYIKSNGFNLTEEHSFYLNSMLFWILMLAPVGILSLLLIVRKRILEAQKDVVGMRRKRAKKMATKHLKAAEEFMNNNETSKFYEEILRSVNGFISDKFNIPLADLNKTRIEKELRNNGIQATAIKEFMDILNDCEMARFAPLSNNRPQEIYDKVLSIIETIEGGSK